MLQVKKLITISAPLLLLYCVSTAANADTIYVDDDAPGSSNGTDWSNAYKYLQDALTEAESGDQIWVAAGTYKPDLYNAQPWGTGNRNKTFQLINGVGLFGGFPDGGGTWQMRAPNTHKTILSGDINTVNESEDNSEHVVTGSSTDNTAILDGFIITGGYSYDAGEGGGMLNNNGSPTVSNCTFSENWALDDGGGMYNTGSSSTVTNCSFSGNTADWGKGGGMYNSNCNLTVTNCTFIGNSATDSPGGGMHNYGNNPMVTNCTFIDNHASDGGGMCNSSGSSPTVINCTFIDNKVPFWGGGMYNKTGCSPIATNCTFNHNSAGAGGGGIYNDNAGSMAVKNCIFWDNTTGDEGSQIVADDSTITIHHCDIMDGPTGVYASGSGSFIWSGANSDQDPLFVDADGPDDIAGTEDDDVRLSAGSPCIDAGDNDSVPSYIVTDLDTNPRFMDDPATPDSGGGTPIVDLGPYEYGSLCVDIGLRLYDGIDIVKIACEQILSSPLRIAKDGTIYGIVLVQPNDSSASSIQIQTNSGTKAIAKLSQ